MAPLLVEGGNLPGGQVAVAVVVAGRLLGRLLSLPHGVQLCLSGIAPIGPTTGQEGGNGLLMVLPAMTLEHDLLIPVQPQPTQAGQNAVREDLLGALPVRVLNAKQKLAAVASGKQPVEYRCAGGTHVEISRGTGRNANANRHLVVVGSVEPFKQRDRRDSNPQLPP